MITITHLPQIAASPTATSASRRFRATRRTRASSSSATRSARPSSSGCSAARSSLPRYAADRVAPGARSPTSGPSSPSRTTSPTGGPASRASSPTAAASHPGARWKVIGAERADLLPPPAGRPGRSSSSTSCRTSGSPSQLDRRPDRRRAHGSEPWTRRPNARPRLVVDGPWLDRRSRRSFPTPRARPAARICSGRGEDA